MNTLISCAAQYLIFLPVALVLYLLISLPKSKRRELISILIIGGLLVFLLSKIGSQLYNDPRPFYVDHVTPLFSPPHDNGFPSDHTLFSAYIAYCCSLFSKKIGLVLFGTAIVIGAARVAANVHHGIDVVGGLLLAALGVGIATVLVRRWQKAIS